MLGSVRSSWKARIGALGLLALALWLWRGVRMPTPVGQIAEAIEPPPVATHEVVSPKWANWHCIGAGTLSQKAQRHNHPPEYGAK
jgi:hypothetical protein